METNTSGQEKKSSVLMEKVDVLFGKLYKYNLSLLEKSNDPNNGYTGEEVFDFFITSHGQSFLKSFYLGHVESTGIMLNCRSIIEGMALKEMLKKGDITEKQIELLKYQDGLVEKRCYKRFSDAAPEAMFPEQMKENYDFCYENFSRILEKEFEQKEIKTIAYSNIPFLCDPKISFSQIVEKYLDDNLNKMYRVLSVIVHPNPNIEFSKDFTAQAIVAIIKLLEKEYSHLNGDDYTVEKHTLYTTSSYEAQNYIEAVRRIAKALKTIQENFNKNCGNNYVSNTMHSISMLLQEMSIDRVFGFQEQVKCKFKPLAEIVSSFYKNYLDEEKPESRYQLFVEHTNYKVSRALGEKYSFDKAYSAYKELFENGIDSESFQKLFAASTGYSIDEKGKTASINSMVRDVAALIKDDPEKLTFSETLLIDYVESQMLSHANGYMWFSNTGAFSDTNNVILETSYLLGRMFDSLQSYYNGLFKETKEYKYRKTSNVFKEAIKEIHHAFYTIHKLQKKPVVYLNKI